MRRISSKSDGNTMLGSTTALLVIGSVFLLCLAALWDSERRA
jgi:hypothetical protein